MWSEQDGTDGPQAWTEGVTEEAAKEAGPKAQAKSPLQGRRSS